MPRALIEWTDSLRTDHPEIDAEHQAIASILNRLQDEVTAGQDRNLISEILHYLAEQTYIHFNHEHWLMTSAAFPETESHLLAHRKLSDELDRMLYELELASGEISRQALGAFQDWFLGHLRNEDVRLAAFLNQRRAAATTPDAAPAPTTAPAQNDGNCCSKA